MENTNSFKQVQMKKETDKMEQQLKRVIEAAMNSLSFPPVLEDGFGTDEQYDNGVYFRNSDGTLLRGRFVFYSGEFYDQTEEGDVEFCMEVFLTDEGNLMKFYTFTESRNCQHCQETHSHLHRMVAKDQTLDDDYLDAIMNNISVDLRLAS